MFDIELNRDSEENLYTQIYEAIRAEILADKYTPDTRMPSIRKLSSRLNVNAETVVKAYDLLAAENLIYKKEGSGSYIAPAAALKSDDDQRLRILSSKVFSSPDKIIDFSGPENGEEFLEEYSWDLIFDRFYSKYRGNIFKNNLSSSYFDLLKNKFLDIEKNKFYFNSEAQLKEIFKSIISYKSELLFIEGNNNYLFRNFFNSEENSTHDFKTEKANRKNYNVNYSAAEYEDLMNYLEENKIDFIFISDESVTESVLDWSVSKLKSLLELAQMLKFKVVVLQKFDLYNESDKLKELLTSKFKKQLIVVQSLTERVFPGLKSGLVYLEADDFVNQDFKDKIVDNYTLERLINGNNLSAGNNLVYNLLSYYMDNGFLDKRIKYLKQRLKNRKLLLKENIREHFRGVKALNSNSLFYIKLFLNQEIGLHDFRVFCEKNSILLPDHENFTVEQKSNELIISPASLNQFSMKQGVMVLAKIYWQFIS